MKRKPLPKKSILDRENIKWFLVASVCIILVFLSIIGFVSNTDDTEEETGKPAVVLRSQTPTAKPAEIRERLEAARDYEPPDPIQETKDIIASHRERLEENPEDPEAPVLLEAMGNLYLLRLQDYEMAAYCYEQLLRRYPDSKERAYMGLVTALERANDVEGTVRICREIRKEFPEDSVMYQWAVEKVRKDIWEMSSRVPETLPVAPEEQASPDAETSSENAPRD